MTCLSNDEPIAQATTDKALQTATYIHCLQPLASCREDYTAAVVPNGARGSRRNAYVPADSFRGINTRLLC
jgi:hypothetical protein